MKKKKIMIVPCSGANMTGEIARRASVVVCEETRSDVAGLMSITSTAKAMIYGDGNTLHHLLRLLKGQKVICVEGCDYACSRGILEFAGVKPDFSLDVGVLLGKTGYSLKKITEDNVNKTVEAIERLVDELNKK